MERDDQQDAQTWHRSATDSNALPGITTIIFIAPNPEVELEDVVRGLLQPLRQGEWRFVFIPYNLLIHVVRELRSFLALESVHNALAHLSMGG